VILSGSVNELNRLDRQVSQIDRELFTNIQKQPKETVVQKVEPAPLVPIADRQTPDPFESSLLNYKIEPEQSAGEGQVDPFASSMMNFRLESIQTIQPYDISDREAWRSFIPSLLKVSYKLACRRILEFLSRQYGIESSLWLQREAGEFETAAVYGEFEDKPVRFGITPDD